MKTKHKRNIRILKITGAVACAGLVIYLLLWMFAPNQLQRLGSGLRDLSGAGKTRPITIATAGKDGHYYRLGRLLKQEMKKNHGRELNILFWCLTPLI